MPQDLYNYPPDSPYNLPLEADSNSGYPDAYQPGSNDYPVSDLRDIGLHDSQLLPDEPLATDVADPEEPFSTIGTTDVNLGSGPEKGSSEPGDSNGVLASEGAESGDEAIPMLERVTPEPSGDTLPVAATSEGVDADSAASSAMKDDALPTVSDDERAAALSQESDSLVAPGTQPNFSDTAGHYQESHGDDTEAKDLQSKSEQPDTPLGNLTVRGAISPAPGADTHQSELEEYIARPQINELEKASPPPEQLRTASDLLLEHGADNYTVDAHGFARTIANAYSSSPDHLEYRESDCNKAMVALGEYAVCAGDGNLANYVFEQLSLGQKWLLYAKAYEAAELETEQLAQWAIYLESAPQQELAARDDQTQALRCLALAEIALLRYEATQNPESRQEYRNEAQDNRAQFEAIIARDHLDGLGKHEIRVYRTCLGIAFIRAGLWQDMTTLDKYGPRGHRRYNPFADINLQVLGKALRGQLTMAERWQLRSWEAATCEATCDALCIIDDQRNGVGVIEDISQRYDHPYIQDQVVLEELAPRDAYRLGLQPTSDFMGLRLALAVGDAAQAEQLYHDILLDPRNRPDHLSAALLMSRYRSEIEPSKVVHALDKENLFREIAALEAYIEECVQTGNQPHQGVVAETLERLSRAEGQLIDQIDSLLVQGRLVHLHERAGIEKAHVLGVQVSWRNLERQAGRTDRLIGVRQALQSYGFSFVRHWWDLAGGGYVGYVPVHRAFPERVESDFISFLTDLDGLGGYMEESRIGVLEKAARELNEILGEERYVVVRSDRTRQVHPDNEPERFITITGTWQAVDVGSELSPAYVLKSLQEDSPLDNQPELSERLRRIVEG